MQLLENPIRPYAWGSHTAIAALQGRPTPTAQPEAELWIGAHPSAPSTLRPAGVRLDEAVAADPAGLLGGPVVEKFGARLPYLLKLLAAAQPLSLQAHPDSAQARVGYDAEQAAGVPGDAPGRNYADPYHKPELLVALTDFEALCGFQEPARAAAVLESFGVAALRPVVEVLRGGDAGAALRGAVELLMGWPKEERGDLVAALTRAGREKTLLEYAESHALAAELGARYPADMGVAVALLLNRVHLDPREAVWMPAGNLHAYLSGFGVEIMAASDNVLRGGLTPKHVDVAELLKVLRFEVLADPVVRSGPLAQWPGVLSWPTPVPEFRLVSALCPGATGLPTVALPPDGPREVVCVAGRVHISDGTEVLELTAGQALFVPASAGSLQVSGEGEIFQAGTP